MGSQNKWSLVSFLFAALLLFNGVFASQGMSIPVTGDASVNKSPAANFLSLTDFTAAVKNGNASQVTGVYVSDKFAFRVVQQPKNDPAYVSAIDGVVTQFSQAAANQTIGLLAHNFAAGASFSKLETGDTINVVYGNGSVKSFTVTKILRFQALDPKNPSSSFTNLDSGDKLTATQLFNQVYGGSSHLTFQTCIQQGKEDSWGRLFILAQPVTGK
jgi:hypothetical protein